MINIVIKIVLFLVIYVGNTDAMEVSTLDIAIKVPDSYSVNIMCINPKKVPEHKYIFCIDNENELIDMILGPVIKWAKANLTAQVDFWIDYDTVTDEQVKNTQLILTKLLANNSLKNNKMRNVREIPIIRDNPDAFSDQVHVYDRVDLFKLIIIVYSIESENKASAIIADLQVGDLRPEQDRMGEAELFDKDAMQNLVDYGGLLHNAREILEYWKDGIKHTKIIGNENQFFQLINNPLMIQAIKTHIINVNLERIKDALNNLNNEDWPEYFSITALGGPIFRSVIEGVYYFYILIAPQEQTIKLRKYLASDQYTCFGPRRIVDVRGGKCHFIKRSDLTTRLPANGDTYCVKLWE